MLEKGWAEKDNGTFQITKAGRKLRQEAEERTDDYYFVGLAALNDELVYAAFQTYRQPATH